MRIILNAASNENEYGSTSSAIDYQSIVGDLRFSKNESEQLQHLFKKLVKKGYLGLSSASRLDCLLSKIYYQNLIRIKHPEKHCFILKKKESNDNKENIFKPSKINERDINSKTKLQKAIIGYKEKPSEEDKNILSAGQVIAKNREHHQTISLMDRILNNPDLDINLTDEKGRTALFQATQISNPMIITKILAKQGVVVNVRTQNGTTPLIRAAKKNNLKAVKLLLKNGADINAENSKGSALIHAVKQEHVDIVKFLIKKNADLDSFDKFKKMTALDWAQVKRNKEIIEVLEKEEEKRSPFTVSSYNCGGYINHSDYLRAACMSKIMHERFNEENDDMELLEEIQNLGLKKIFIEDPQEKKIIKEKWKLENFKEIYNRITEPHSNKDSKNHIWNNTVNKIISPYYQQPPSIYDAEIMNKIQKHVFSITRRAYKIETLTKTRELIIKQTIQDKLNSDIICLQEVEYLDPKFFSCEYEVILDKSVSRNGIAWNKNRFVCIDVAHLDKCSIVRLQDRTTLKIIAVASGHIYGCNAFNVQLNKKDGQPDSEKGDQQLINVLNYLNTIEADMEILGLDLNVTALHPRMKLLKKNNYKLDHERFLGPTCTNPVMLLNTRIDWIALKNRNTNASIKNIPINDIGLNDIYTNASDHKPIASVIKYNL